MRSILCVITLSLTACSGLSGDLRPTFDQPELNQTWYGAYHRPLPDADATRAQASRERRDGDRASGRASAEPVASAATTQPSSAATIPDAAVGGYDPVTAAAYVRDVYSLNETPIGEGRMNVVDVYRFTQEHGQIYHSPRPAVGDLVFFHNTQDANSDGRPNDWYTHVGIVESVDAEDTVTVLSYSGGNVGRIYMNRRQPGDEADGSNVLNSRLREPRRSDAAHTEYLAGHLFAGFGSLLGERTEVVVLDVWQPADSPSLRASR